MMAMGGKARLDDRKRRPASRARSFLHDRRGAGAVEFAMIFPVLMVVYISGSELGIAITLNRKVQHVSATISDLITQETEMDAEGMEGLFRINQAILEPYDASKLKAKFTQIRIDENGQAEVDWSWASEGETKEPCGAYGLPEEFAELTGRHLLVSEVTYPYTPLGGYGLDDPILMVEKTYFNPRIGTRIDYEYECP